VTTTAPTPVLPQVTNLAERTRCVRAATLTGPSAGSSGLSFSFDLSVSGTVSYVITRRDSSPGKRRCPTGAGHSHSPITTVSHTSGPGQSGANNTSLGSAARALPRSARRALGAGRHRTSLARITQGQKLAPGTYVLKVQETDALGRNSNIARVKFWVLSG